MFARVVLTLPVLASLICSVLHASLQPLLLLLCCNEHANSAMLMDVIVFRCVCFVPRCTIHIMTPACASSRTCLCVFGYMRVCALPALLLNNPAYHLLLSDHRHGSRPLVVPSTAQEKSLNVPQGKRPQTGPTQSGGAPFLSTYLPFRAGALEVLSHRDASGIR